jgi:predicted DNA-binding transcriptional regulator AlpA
MASTGKSANTHGCELKNLLSPQNVSEITGIALSTLAQWRSQKCAIPYCKLGRKIGYHPDDIQQYLESCRVSVSARRQRRQM